MTPRARVASSRRRHAPRNVPDVYAALAEPSRRRLLDMLADGERPVHELASAFDVTRPAISQHLRVLRDAGLVAETRVGRERWYRLQAAALQEVHAWVSRYEAFWDERLTQLGAALEREAAREAASPGWRGS
jgi:DNA-binding transcriptional ArsR family regulator